MCSSAMRKMICTLGEHGRDQTRARQERVKEDGARKSRAVCSQKVVANDCANP